MTADVPAQDELGQLMLSWDGVSTRGMFGGVGYFVGDRLFAAIHKGRLITKLPQSEREEALAHQLARPFATVPGRPFGDWVEFSLEGTGRAEAVLPWLQKGFECVQATPPKGRRTSRRKR
ncbi:MAG: TfoX/Sxy family protein [Chloroflexi bacterium]|nr:TfoX/Sxy family protein [Chloroflexota bacterium]